MTLKAYYLDDDRDDYDGEMIRDVDNVEEVLAPIPSTSTPNPPTERPPDTNFSVNSGPDPIEVTAR